MAMKSKILFVCMGNICRSPTAEGIFRKLVNEHSSLVNIEIDSCGTIGYHVGEPPDHRSVSFAKRRGYDLSPIRSRKISIEDFEYFDLILAMDIENLNNLKVIADNNERHLKKIGLFLDFDVTNSVRIVPDPYYGGSSGFDDVIDLIEAASKGLIVHLLAQK